MMVLFGIYVTIIASALLLGLLCTFVAPTNSTMCSLAPIFLCTALVMFIVPVFIFGIYFTFCGVGHYE